MSPDEIIGMSIFFGSIVAVIFIITVGSIVKAWLKKNSSKSLSENQEFLDALREFKENMERRMSNLEEIVSEERFSSLSAKVEKKNTQRAIELEFDDESREERKAEETAKLRNMLNQ